MTSQSVPAGGGVKLMLCLGAVAFIWCCALPMLATWPPVASHLKTLRENDIDAGVMFYSEHKPGVVPDQERINEILASRRR